MRWVRVHSDYDYWPSNGPAPTFCITSDDDGEAFLEIAKTRELLIHPYSDPNDPWNCFFTQTGSNDGSVAATTIQITGGRAEYTLPDAVWTQMRNVAGSAAGELFYRVKARPGSSSSEAYASHGDTAVQNREVPSIQVVPVRGTPEVSVFSDTAAIAFLSAWEQLMLAIIPLMGANDAEYIGLQKLLAHQVYTGQNSPRVRAKVLQLFVKSSGAARQLFERLLDIRVAVGSSADGGYMTEPALYYRDERGEGTTLDHLLALYDVQLDPRVLVSRSDVILDVIVELIDPPGQMNQGAAGTCAATTVQTYVAIRNPAEYARWCRYILDRRQSHTVTLANGGSMRANPEAFDQATHVAIEPGAAGRRRQLLTRTYSERGVQAAVMQYASGSNYDPEHDNFGSGVLGDSGLTDPQVERILEHTFNQPWTIDSSANVRQNLMDHFQNWGLPVVMGFSNWDSFGHAVLGLRVENGRVIFRNPQYRGSYPPLNPATHRPYADGEVAADPTRTIHDVSRSEESMDLAELQAAVMDAFIHEN